MAESRNSRGYILPENITPEGMICLKVYIPDDPLYLAAFSGAYERLGTWQVWEKDGTNRASQAAQHWKDVIDFTRQNGWIGECGMSSECCQEIVDAIKALKLNVTVTSGCGCNVVDDYKFPDDWENDTETFPPPPPLDTDPPTTEGGEFCDMAHEAFQQMYEMIEGFVSRLAEFEPYYSIAEFLDEVAIVAPKAGAIYEMISRYLLAAYGKLVEDSQNYMLQLKEQIICIMVNSDSSEEATEAIKQLILDSTWIPFTTREWLYALYSSLNLNALYDGTLGNRPEFDGSSCAFCLPNAPEGYRWVTLINGEFETAPNAGTGFVSYFQDYGEFTMTPLLASTFHEVWVNVDVSDLLAREGAISAHAIFVKFLGAPPVSNNGSDGISLSSNTGGLTLARHDVPTRLHYDNTEYANVAAFEEFVDSGQFPSKSNYGNGAMDDVKASFRMQSYGTSGASEIWAYVAYLVKE